MKTFKIYFSFLLLMPCIMYAQINNSLGQNDTIPTLNESIQSVYSIIETNNNCQPNVPFEGQVIIQNKYDTISLTPVVDVPGTPPPPPQTEEDKAVYWLHGLNGNEGAWSWASGQFSSNNGPEQAEGVDPRRIVNSGYLNYYNLQNTEIITAAANFRTEFADAFPGESQLQNRDRTRSIAFGHSQGGLMLRALDYQYRTNPLADGIPSIGGFVTFCTPNQGAHLVERGDEMIDYIKKFSIGVADAEIENLDDFIPGWLQFFGINIDSEAVAGLIGDELFSWLGQLVLNSQLPNITESYKPGSESLQTLNSYETTMEQIVAVASERPLITAAKATYTDPRGNVVTTNDFPVPLSWATLEYFLTPPNESAPFEAHTREHDLAVTMHEMRLQYLANQIREDNKEYNYRKTAKKGYRDAAIFSALCPVCKPCCVIAGTALAFAIANEWNANDASENAEAFKRGVQAFGDFDQNYRIALGLRTLESTETNLGNRCKCTDQYGFVEYYEVPPSGSCFEYAEDPSALGNLRICKIESVTSKRELWVDHPSDGVVRLSSQMEIPQANKSVVIGDEEGEKGSTHMAIRNDENGKQILTEIFDGNHGDFFFAQVRNP